LLDGEATKQRRAGILSLNMVLNGKARIRDAFIKALGLRRVPMRLVSASHDVRSTPKAETNCTAKIVRNLSGTNPSCGSQMITNSNLTGSTTVRYWQLRFEGLRLAYIHDIVKRARQGLLVQSEGPFSHQVKLQVR
jgi:hypothetical protein